jgi:protein TonB
MRIFLIAFLLLSINGWGQEKKGTIHVKKPAGTGMGVISEVFIDPDEYFPARYKEGEAALKKFIASTIRLPEKVKNKKVSGICYTSFTVDAQGKVFGFVINEGIPSCRECDIEAFRILQLMGPWLPGTVNGKADVTTVNLPIEFKQE